MSKKLDEMIENFIQEACSFNIIDDTDSKNITTHKGCNHQLMIILREKLQLSSFKQILRLVAEESAKNVILEPSNYYGYNRYLDENWFEKFIGNDNAK